MKVISPSKALKLNIRDVESEAREYVSTRQEVLYGYRGVPIEFERPQDPALKKAVVRILEKSGWKVSKKDDKTWEMFAKGVSEHFQIAAFISVIFSVVLCIADIMAVCTFKPDLGLSSVAVFIITGLLGYHAWRE